MIEYEYKRRRRSREKNLYSKSYAKRRASKERKKEQTRKRRYRTSVHNHKCFLKLQKHEIEKSEKYIYVIWNRRLGHSLCSTPLPSIYRLEAKVRRCQIYIRKCIIKNAEPYLCLFRCCSFFFNRDKVYGAPKPCLAHFDIRLKQ